MKNQRCTTYALAVAAVILAIMPGTAFAIDGQIAINQARAMAGGVTPGDAPGFPVSITQPGSYVFSGILTVPNANTTALVISASHVTIDLNGFTILGPTDCSGGSCVPAGDGIGITTDTSFGLGTNPEFNITIRNGTIQGMGGGGIHLFGDSHLVEYMHVRSNGGVNGGIAIFTSQDAGSSIVQHSTVQRNQNTGIGVQRGAVRYNVVDVNGGVGIFVTVGSVSYNVVTRNTFGGILISTGASAFGNTMSDNPGANGNLGGPGSNEGQNHCSGTGGTC